MNKNGLHQWPRGVCPPLEPMGLTELFLISFWLSQVSTPTRRLCSSDGIAAEKQACLGVRNLLVNWSQLVGLDAVVFLTAPRPLQPLQAKGAEQPNEGECK